MGVGDCEETLKLIADDKLNTEPLITHIYPVVKLDGCMSCLKTNSMELLRLRWSVKDIIKEMAAITLIVNTAMILLNVKDFDFVIIVIERLPKYKC